MLIPMSLRSYFYTQVSENFVAPMIKSYSHRFRDIAVRRQLGIMTRTAGHRERKD